jgi:hypothetical protein
MLGRRAAAKVHVAVIRITGEGMSSPLQFPVQVRQHDVAQQRRQRPALRRAFRSWLHEPITHQTRLQEAADESEHPGVPNLSCHSCHQQVVVDPVEELGQVEVYHPAPAASDVVPGGLHRLPRIAPGSEAVARLTEPVLEDRLQDLQHRLLDQPVHHGGHTQCPDPTRGFGDVHRAHFPWQVAARQQRRLH